MKKALAILLILTLSVSILAGCGGKAEDPTPTPTSTPTATPTPTPDGPKTETVTLLSPDYGDISFSYIDDGSLTVTAACDPDEVCLDVLGEDVFDETLYYPGTVQYQRAHIKGDGFHIVIGYTDYRENSYRTFSMYMNSGFWNDPEESIYGGVKGYSLLNKIYFLTFPATTQFASRIIAIYPDSVSDEEKVEDKCEELLGLPAVRAILDSLKFSGEFKNEPRFETQPIDDKFFAISPTDGWEITYYSDGFNSYTLRKEGVGNGRFGRSYAELHIEKWGLSSPKEELDDKLDGDFYDEAVRLDDITINGQKFFVIQDASWSYIWLYTSIGAFDENKSGYIEIKISYVDDIEAAMSLLQTVTIKP
ncbi:MAG: hypothetical protein FWF44_11580 [Defluviitaleaceae bacterium]|nr:hypothetical protein [Defluviitaleaceae bacterium]